MAELALILAAIDAAVKIGGTLGAALLTTIEGSHTAPAEARRRATAARERLAQSTARYDEQLARDKAELAGEPASPDRDDAAGPL